MHEVVWKLLSGDVQVRWIVVLEHALYEFGVEELVLLEGVVEVFLVALAHSIPLLSLLLFILLLLLVDEELLLVVDESLLALDVLEHVLVLREHHVVGEHLRVLFVELEDLGQTHLGLLGGVAALEELAHVVVDEVVLEDGDQPSGLVVDYVVYDLGLVVLTTGHVLLGQLVGDEWMLQVALRRLQTDQAVILRGVEQHEQVSVLLEVVHVQSLVELHRRILKLTLNRIPLQLLLLLLLRSGECLRDE